VRLGVHVSIGKGFKGAIVQAKARGCDGFQIFVGNPRGWARKPIPNEEFIEFKKHRENHELWPIVVHLAYLPNPASVDPDLYQKSVLTLVEDFTRANRLGADFFVFHPGKSKDRIVGMSLVSETINKLLEEIKGPTVLLFENQAGGGSEIAGEFKDLGFMLDGIQQKERVGVCLDTCHAFAAGYDLRNPSAWEKTLAEFDHTVGLAFLKMFHLNDSLGDLGAHLDRHQNIGEGTIGLEGFRYLMNHPLLGALPGILETPQRSDDDDLKNLAVLRGLKAM
jgi:deoxyribonuclease-4